MGDPQEVTLRDALDAEVLAVEPIVTPLDIARLGGWQAEAYWLVMKDRRDNAWLN